MRRERLYRLWHEQSGSQSLNAAGVSVATALVAVALLFGVLAISTPGMQRTLSCAVALISGGGNCGGGTSIGPDTGGTGSQPAGEDGSSGVKQGASIGLDFIPFVGEIKGLIEVFTGKDLVTGEDLGWWRFAGLAGLIGLNELKLLRHGDDVARHIDSIDDLIRRADDAPRRIPCVSAAPGGRGRGLAAPLSACPQATFGRATSFDYKKTFFDAHPELEGKVVVHHAVEQQVLRRYPGLITEAELHSLENLRGIPKSINADVHLSQIRKRWNQFYRENPNPTKQQLLDYATKIDQEFGYLFTPPVK